MLDLLYLLGTVAFFALMLSYVSFCARLAGAADANDAKSETRA